MGNSKLYLQQLDLLLHTMPLDVQNVTDLLDTAVKAEGVSDKHKLLFTQRKAEFLQDFGENISALEEAEKEVEKMLKKMPGLGNSTVPGIPAIQAKLDRATTANGDTLDIPPHPHKQGFGLKQDPPNHFVDHNFSLSLSA